MNDLTIVMYHYVRDLERTRYPEIKGRTTTDFRKQVAYLTRNYHPVTVQDLIAALFHGESLPPNAMLLTFDDGYIDHFANVFPVLHDKGVQGLFFPPLPLHVVENSSALIVYIFCWRPSIFRTWPDRWKPAWIGFPSSTGWSRSLNTESVGLIPDVLTTQRRCT